MRPGVVAEKITGLEPRWGVREVSGVISAPSVSSGFSVRAVAGVEKISGSFDSSLMSKAGFFRVVDGVLNIGGGGLVE